MRFDRHHIFIVLSLLFLPLLVISCAGAPPAKSVAVRPLQVEKGSPEKSFWRDHVQYPFGVKYARARDGKGVEWEVAYMDEYYGAETDPPVLVMIHGKGSFGGYFGHVMKVALENGFRIIVPDLPHFGKSIPGNIDKPLSRSLQDTREVIHDIVGRQLEVKKASYLGHSLGGQWVLGYALAYPEAVEKIILECPSGLEEYPAKIMVGDKEMPLFEDAQREMKVWKIVWGTRLKQGLAQDEECWRNFAYFKQKNQQTGKIEPAKTGFFVNDTEYARAFTEIRAALIRGNKREHYNFCVADARDIYSLGVEVRRDDPQSLYKKIKNIKAPVFLTFGERDPLIPTPLSGKSDLRWDIVKPFYDDLKKAGNPPLIKVYAGAGHFIHTDFPELYARDVVGFLRQSKIAGLDSVEHYKAPDVPPPADVQRFFNQYRADMLTRDMKRISAHYAQDFKQDGCARDAFLKGLNDTVSVVTNYVVKLTKFEPVANNPNVVIIDGTVDLGPVTAPFADRSMIIKENGVWKWYGNQK